MTRTPLRTCTKRASQLTALAASAALAFSLVPAPALADTAGESTAAHARTAAAGGAADRSVAEAFFDSLYLPEGADLNDVAPAGSPSSVGALYTAPAGDAAALSASALPETFDLRDVGDAGTSYVTPVKSQNPWGSCWVFAALSALESSLAIQGAASADPSAEDYVDLSERFVGYFARTPMPKETLALFGASSQAGEGASARTVHELDTGGNVLGAANNLLSMGGAAAESSAPYQNDEGEIISWEDALLGPVSCYSPEGTWSLDEALRADTENRAAFLKSAEVLPGPYNSFFNENDELELGAYDPENTEAAKRALMQGGALVVDYYADTSQPEDQPQGTRFFSLENWCQYTCEPLFANHSVTVVGWDDTYSRTNFPTEPAGDGAWIVKNSWGRIDGGPGALYNWGIDGSGYFYLSYYDQSLYSFCALTAEPSADSREIVQQYDLVDTYEVVADPLMSAQESSVANVFTAERDMLARSVTVRTATAGMEATVQIYLLDDDATAPDDGVLVAEQSETLPHTGCYVIDLDTAVPVQEGQRYSVVQTIEGTFVDPETGDAVAIWGLPLERGLTRSFVEESDYPFFVDVVINEGESFFTLDGAWEDAAVLNEDPDATGGIIAYGNVGIKVFGQPAALPDAGSLDIVHTNDIHGHYAVKGADGAADNAFSAVAALAQDEQADLILDAGDTFHGTAFATYDEGAGIAKLMDAAGYDATTPGNHDWSYGFARLAEIDESARFSILAANVSDRATGGALFENATLLREVALQDASGNLTGKSATVGVIGVIDEGFYGSTAPSNVEGLAFDNAVSTANAEAAKLRDAGAEIVIALTHNGDPQAFAAASRGIDAVVAGHDHIAMNETVTSADGRSVAVVEAASSPQTDYFGSIGLLSLSVEQDADGKGFVAGHEAKTFSPADLARPNEAIDGLTDELVAASEAALAQVIGTSTRAYEYLESSGDAPGGWELVRTQDTPIGHVVTGAYLAQTGADLAFENAGGIRGGIPAGEVTAGDILAASPYGNTVATYELTGAQIIEAIERSLVISNACRDVLAKQMAAVQAGEDPLQYRWPDAAGSVLAVGGADMEVDWDKPDGSRVRSITIKGEPIEASRTYIVAMNDYLAGASSIYTALAKAPLVHEHGTCEEALRSLIARPDWEQTVAAISGSTTYVSEGGSGSGEGEGGVPGSGADTGGQGSGATSGAGTAAPTGDPRGGIAGGLALAAAFSALAALIAARRRAR